MTTPSTRSCWTPGFDDTYWHYWHYWRRDHTGQAANDRTDLEGQFAAIDLDLDALLGPDLDLEALDRSQSQPYEPDHGQRPQERDQKEADVGDNACGYPP